MRSTLTTRPAIRFATVGAGATLIHVACAALLIDALGTDPALANGAAFVLSNTASYFANTKWTFRAHVNRGSYGRFLLVSVFACALTMLVAKAADLGGLHHYVGILLVIATIPLISYLAHRFYTFRVDRVTPSQLDAEGKPSGRP